VRQKGPCSLPFIRRTAIILRFRDMAISNSSYGALLKLHYIAGQSASFVRKYVFYLKKSLKFLVKISEVFLCQSLTEGENTP